MLNGKINTFGFAPILDESKYENFLKFGRDYTGGSCTTHIKTDSVSDLIFSVADEVASGAQMVVEMSMKTLMALHANNPNLVIAKGHTYEIGREYDDSRFRGYGGRKFRVNFKDGREVITTNLWSGYTICELFKPYLQDNATITAIE